MEESTAGNEIYKVVDIDEEKVKKCSPYKAACIVVSLIIPTIAKTPMALNQVLQTLVKQYKKQYCFMPAIIQKTPTKALKLIFGEADDNVGYALFCQDGLTNEEYHLQINSREGKTCIEHGEDCYCR